MRWQNGEVNWLHNERFIYTRVHTQIKTSCMYICTHDVHQFNLHIHTLSASTPTKASLKQTQTCMYTPWRTLHIILTSFKAGHLFQSPMYTVAKIVGQKLRVAYEDREKKNLLNCILHTYVEMNVRVQYTSILWECPVYAAQTEQMRVHGTH